MEDQFDIKDIAFLKISLGRNLRDKYLVSRRVTGTRYGNSSSIIQFKNYPW